MAHLRPSLSFPDGLSVMTGNGVSVPVDSGVFAAFAFGHGSATEHNALVPLCLFTIVLLVCVAFRCERLQEVCEGLSRCVASPDIRGFYVYRWCSSLWSVLALFVSLWRTWRHNLLHHLWT